jgi:hypothetical protein
VLKVQRFAFLVAARRVARRGNGPMQGARKACALPEVVNRGIVRLVLLLLLCVASSGCVTMTTDDPVTGTHCDNTMGGFLFWQHAESKCVDRQGKPIASPSSKTGLSLTP